MGRKIVLHFSDLPPVKQKQFESVFRANVCFTKQCKITNTAAATRAEVLQDSFYHVYGVKNTPCEFFVKW